MILLKNCHIIKVEEKQIIEGDILVDKNKIIKIGENLKAEGPEIFDLKGAYVCAGFIDLCTQMSLESGSKIEKSDADEPYAEIIAGMKTANAIYPFNISFKEALFSGITSVIVNSGKLNVIGAQSCLVKTNDNDIEKMIENPCIDIKANLGDTPKKWNQNMQTTPLSRMGIMNLLRKSLKETEAYMEASTEINLNYEALKKVLRKEIPLKITANKSQDIMSAIELKKEFDIKVILDEGAEAYSLKEYLKEADIPVILNTTLIDTSSLELRNSREDTARTLIDAGILTAISTHHPDVNSDLLLFSAVMLMREGLDMYEALSLITANPAKIMGIYNEIGSIDENKTADIIVFDELPIKTKANLVLTMIKGEIAYKKEAYSSL